jgi:uncharacterized protein YcfJ
MFALGTPLEDFMNMKLRTAVGIAALGLSTLAAAQVTFYEFEGFRGRSFTVDALTPNFDPLGYNDRARSAIVDNGRWEVCEDAGFNGRCAIIRRGSYESLSGMGLNAKISSVRPVGRNADVVSVYEAPPQYAQPSYPYYQRPGETLYEAQVTSVRAVVGPPEQRCWVEREQVREPSGANIPGAIVGAVIGGVLGHQVGSGRGRDAATVGGAVVGGAVGANVGRGSGEVYGRDVQRCTNVSSSAQPAYWDVTYNFNGYDYRAQMTAPPGPTLTVNGNGEPRG